MKKILLCLDTDSQPSVFDGVVAVDAGVDHLLRHGGVDPGQVRDLVHGLMFTRGDEDRCHSAVFIGGTDVAAAEGLLAAVQDSFFGPVRISVMLDPSGANTTAAAAVVAASRHLPLGPETTATVLGATGPVGQRVVRLLAGEGVRVRVVSRRTERARAVCDRVKGVLPEARLSAHALSPNDPSAEAPAELLEGTSLLVGAGAAGVELLSETDRTACETLAVAIDLNAVPPAGLGGIAPQDKAADRHGQCCYGALGVGGLKMKIHKRAISQLFTTSDLVLDAEPIYALGKQLA